MTDELEDKVEVQETVEEPAEEEPKDESTPEEVASARNMGWIPKEQFKGDASKWRPAKEYLARGREMLPIVLQRNRKLESDIEELKKGQKEFIDFTRKAAKRDAEAKIAELQAEKDAAFDSGDKEAFAKAEKQIAEVERSAVAPAEIEVSPHKTEVDEWFAENKWYQTDKKMAVFADKMADFIKAETEMETGKPLLGKPLLERVKAEVEKRFPERFSNPERNRAAAVAAAGGNSAGGGGRKGRGFSDLPVESQRACSNMVKQG